MFDTINHKEEIIDYIICRSQVIKQFQMKKQYLTHKQKKLETPNNINSTFQNQKAKSQINRTEGISFSHHRYPEKQQPHSHTHNYYKEPGHQKTVNLLNRLKSVRRIHFQDNEQEKWYDIKMNINEVYNQRKLMEEDINSSSKYIRRNLSKHGKYWQTEESQLNDLELRKLLKELRGLNSQMIKIEQQKEELQDQIQWLRRQNERLKAEVVQNKQKVQSLKNQHRISQKFSMQKLFELQEFIQSLEEQNQQLVQEIQKLRKDRNQNQQIIHQQRSEQMQIVSQILTVTIFPTENREMQVLEKQFKDLKLQILSMEKKHLGNINQIKKEYQKEIFTVRNNYFKNLNFYRNLIKKMSTNRIADSLREPEEILKTDLIEMDQDLEDIDIDDTLQTNTDTYDK